MESFLLGPSSQVKQDRIHGKVNESYPDGIYDETPILKGIHVDPGRWPEHRPKRTTIKAGLRPTEPDGEY